MNIEELKMVLETINTTTGLAKDMGTTWIWLHYGFKVLDGLAWIVGVTVVVYGMYRMARMLNSADIDSPFMRSCRNKLGTGSPGIMTEEEYYATTTKIMELVDQYRREQK
jgi:hypothetical protein